MPSHIDTDPILAEIEAFLASSGMAATQFGYQVMGDPGFVHELRRGRECRRRTRNKIVSFIEKYRENPISHKREDRPIRPDSSLPGSP